ncbi:MAG TPA: hypothetical protein VN132_03055, partial [Bdellovibrio sp.]|nr:hypothetical protein [Bdellovibrio sp.]
FGVGSFPDDLDRYKLLGEAERHLSMAMKHAGMHFISFFRAYSIKDYFTLQTELGKLNVQDAFPSLFTTGFREVEGVTLQKRADTIRNFHSTFLLYQDGQTYLSKYAWPNLVRSIQELGLVWDEVKDKPENQRRILNPAFLNAFGRGTEETIKSWKGVIEGQPLKSRLTDRVVRFDLHNFYTNPVADLKTFLPKSAVNATSVRFKDNKFKTYVLDTKGNRVAAPERFNKYRNWYYGEQKVWDVTAWQKVFPDLKSSDDLPQTLRTMNQAWGGSTMALPLMQFVR